MNPSERTPEHIAAQKSARRKQWKKRWAAMAEKRGARMRIFTKAEADSHLMGGNYCLPVGSFVLPDEVVAYIRDLEKKAERLRTISTAIGTQLAAGATP